MYHVLDWTHEMMMVVWTRTVERKWHLASFKNFCWRALLSSSVRLEARIEENYMNYFEKWCLNFRSKVLILLSDCFALSCAVAESVCLWGFEIDRSRIVKIVVDKKCELRRRVSSFSVTKTPDIDTTLTIRHILWGVEAGEKVKGANFIYYTHVSQIFQLSLFLSCVANNLFRLLISAFRWERSREEEVGVWWRKRR